MWATEQHHGENVLGSENFEWYLVLTSLVFGKTSASSAQAIFSIPEATRPCLRYLKSFVSLYVKCNLSLARTCHNDTSMKSRERKKQTRCLRRQLTIVELEQS